MQPSRPRRPLLLAGDELFDSADTSPRRQEPKHHPFSHTDAHRHLSGCAALIIEANHDVKMLEEGPYPWHLKQRVKSRVGHLSNESCRDLIGEILHPGLAHVILGHLSETNNTPETALNAVAPALNGHPAALCAAHQNHCGKLIVIE